MGDGFVDGFLGERVKDDPAEFVFADERRDVPGDGFAFSVGVHGEEDLGGFLGEFPNFAHRPGRAYDHLVGRYDLAVFEGDRKVAFRRQVANKTERSGDPVFGTEEAADLADFAG